MGFWHPQLGYVSDGEIEQAERDLHKSALQEKLAAEEKQRLREALARAPHLRCGIHWDTPEGARACGKPALGMLASGALICESCAEKGFAVRVDGRWEWARFSQIAYAPRQAAKSTNFGAPDPAYSFVRGLEGEEAFRARIKATLAAASTSMTAADADLDAFAHAAGLVRSAGETDAELRARLAPVLMPIKTRLPAEVPAIPKLPMLGDEPASPDESERHVPDEWVWGDP